MGLLCHIFYNTFAWVVFANLLAALSAIGYAYFALESRNPLAGVEILLYSFFALIALIDAVFIPLYLFVARRRCP